MDNWLAAVEKRVETFAERYALTYAKSDRAIAAAFEIGCFHALVDFYHAKCALEPTNLAGDSFRYLTSPSGNPKNFSYVSLEHDTGRFHLRQQVRIRSHHDEDIAFTPDMLVVAEEAVIRNDRDPDFANGKRSFFAVDGLEVLAAHECKSMVPFPELLVSFIGMFVAAHGWFEDPNHLAHVSDKERHLAPSLFVGGTASGLHARMAGAMSKKYPINIFLGLHSSTWALADTSAIRTLSSSIVSK
jgi:hypothetical protein